MLYLPPNVAHHGVALESGMTYSIGSRAPSGADLLQGLGEWLAFRTDEGGRYTDTELKSAGRAGEIDTKALQGLRKLMQAGIDGGIGPNEYLAAFMSRFRLAHEPVPPPELIQADVLLDRFMKGAGLFRNPWTRLTWIEKSNAARLFAAGQPFDCTISLAVSLCESQQPRINAGKLDQDSLEVLTELVNRGHFLLIDT